MDKIKLLLDTLLDVVSDIRSLADSLEALTKAICDEGSIPKIAESKATAAKTANKTHEERKLTLEDVRSVLSEISANGHGAEIRELLKKYGQTKLSEIDPKDYPALLKDAEVLK